MDVSIFLILFSIATVYQIECTTTRGKQKRNELFKSEPHPYTISFFTFQKGAASDLLASKTTTKSHNEGSPDHDNEVQTLGDGSGSGTADESSGSGDPETKPGHSDKAHTAEKSKVTKTTGKSTHEPVGAHGSDKPVERKHSSSFVHVYEKPNTLDKAGKVPEVGPQKGLQKLEPWKLGTSHNKIQFKVHQKQTEESYQEGSINHPLHTMYPECYHCPSNSSYEECTKKSTLAKCSNGLNNICFTKSFRSSTRGVIYEMGCSNHKKCKTAKATPCKGNNRKCFVCCQYDGCNAFPHHNLYTAKTSDETGFEYLNEAVTYSPSKWITGIVMLLHGIFWMLA